MIKPAPSLAVIVCVHNARDYAEIALESVLRHTGTPFDLIIVDDGSAPPARGMLDQFVKDHPSTRLFRNDQAQGYTKAANIGLRASGADYTVLLNSDTIVSPEWAERIIACGESDQEIGIIGVLSNAATYQSVPEVYSSTGWAQNELPGAVTVAGYAAMVAETAKPIYPRLPVANGFCFTIKRAVIEAIGYLDEEHFPRGYGEENDYCLRAADAGFQIAVADDVYVYHATSKSFGAKGRESYTKAAHLAIREKHGEERLAEVDRTLRENQAMAEVRSRIQAAQQPVLAKAAQSNLSLELPPPNRHLSVLFMLPDCSAKSGGTQVIVETARGLQAFGVRVKIAVHARMREEYATFFAGYEKLFHYYPRKKELYAEAGEFDVAVATIFYSVNMLADLLARYPKMIPAYYVQDYEPLFLDGYPGLKKEAEQSYTLVPNMNLVAISPWVCDVLKEKHGVVTHKIHGMIDQDVFFPDVTRTLSDTVSISAMIRPSTEWRGPEQTMQVLKALKEKYGEKIQVNLFGCTDRELNPEKLTVDFGYTNYGVVGRYDVANILRNSDIFLDLSTFQAFGRTALEAMSCGAAVIAPSAGGTHDFGAHETNLLMIDTLDKTACIDAASRLIEDAALRVNLAANGIETGMRYSLNRSAMEFLFWLNSLKYPQAKAA